MDLLTKRVTIDPDALFVLADLAPAVGVTRAAARGWLLTHLAKGTIPDPVLSVRVGDGREVKIWTAEQGEQIVALYRAERAARGQQ